MTTPIKPGSPIWFTEVDDVQRKGIYLHSYDVGQRPHLVFDCDGVYDTRSSAVELRLLDPHEHSGVTNIRDRDCDNCLHIEAPVGEEPCDQCNGGPLSGWTPAEAEEQPTTRREPTPEQLAIKVGDLLIITQDDGSPVVAKCRRAPWQLPHGDWVLSYEGRTGGFLLTRCWLFPKEGDQ